MQIYKVYSLEDYERSINPKSKWDTLDECWGTTVSNKYETDIDDVFEEAAERAFREYGWECAWYDSPPTFVAIGQDGKVFKSTVGIEDRPVFRCGKVEEIK